MTGKQQTDESLMEKVVEGNTISMEVLVMRYASSLLTFIQRMTGNLHRSEDMVQEVFLAVWAKRMTYRSGYAFKPWLYKIAINRCRADFRKAHLPVVNSPPEYDLPAEQPDKGFSPIATMVANETATIVEAAVRVLPVQQRTAIVMRIYNGLEYPHIAQAMGCTQATVRSHMHHALASLRRSLTHRL